MSKTKILLITIIALAFVLRFYKLGINPPSMDWDETADGYNAYSILKTGRDEFGYKLPLSFRSFDDYKPPLYIYMTVPSVAVFGLNNFAVRFPSALLGVLAVFFTYLMVYELFKNQSIALLSSFFLAISPWHLQFSRTAFETNSTIFWTVLGTWAYLRGTKTYGNKLLLWMSLSSFSFGTNLFMYHNSRVFIPLFSLGLLFLFRKILFENLKYLIIPALIAAVFVIVEIPIITSVAGQLRFEGTSIFADQAPKYKASAQIAQDQSEGQLTIGKILHNRRFVYIPILIENYLSNFNLNFLFISADMNRHHAPQVGLLYLWDLPFLLAGTYFLASKRFELKTKIIIFWWFIAAPVAAIVTLGMPHALRTEIYLPIYQIFMAVGVYTFYIYAKNKKLFVITAGLLLFLNFAFYLHQYYVHMPVEYSKDWQFGRKEAAIFSNGIKNNYSRVIVSTKLEQPHEFWLYYLKYDPKTYLEEGGTVSGGWAEDRNKFDKFFFKPIDYQKQKLEAKTLFVGSEKEPPSGVRILKQINYLNGDPAIYIWD